MGTLDTALKASDSAAFNPPHREPIPTQRMADEIEDCLDILRGRGKRILDCIFDGDDNSLTTAEAAKLGDILARLMTCRKDDRTECVEDLQELFKRPLYSEAEEMAEEIINA